MLIREVIQLIQSTYSRGVQSDDTRLSNRHIYAKATAVRNKLVYQKANKKQKLNQWFYQTLPCVELIKAPLSECPCLPPAGCQFLRSRYKLPSPITSLNSHLIQSVTTLDRGAVYSEILPTELKYAKGRKYTSKLVGYFIINGYLFLSVQGSSAPRVVAVTGIFNDPIEANSFPSYCNKDCVDCDDCIDILDREFPIDNDLLNDLIEIVKQELLQTFMNKNKDNLNNTNDDIQEQ